MWRRFQKKEHRLVIFHQSQQSLRMHITIGSHEFSQVNSPSQHRKCAAEWEDPFPAGKRPWRWPLVREKFDWRRLSLAYSNTC